MTLSQEGPIKLVLPFSQDLKKVKTKWYFPYQVGTWCIMDGLKIPIRQQGDDEMTKNAYYSDVMELKS
jgi:hypothetical protein